MCMHPLRPQELHFIQPILGVVERRVINADQAERIILETLSTVDPEPVRSNP